MKMPIQNKFNFSIGNSQKSIETFHPITLHENKVLKNWNDNLQSQQNSLKTETSNYLKNEICNMIQKQLKSYRLHKKLQKQFEDYEKNQSKKKLIEDMHKIQKFRQKQSQVLKARFNIYQNKMQKTKLNLEQIKLQKQQKNIQKKKQNNSKFQIARKRYLKNQTQDIQNRLSRLHSTVSNQSLHAKTVSNTKIHKNLHNSLEKRQMMIFQIQKEQQRIKISKYLQKMRHIENRILMKQLGEQERKQQSIKKKVKNLTKEKILKEQQKMKELEQKFEIKMKNFSDNLSKTQGQNFSLKLNKSRIKNQTRQRVLKKKRINESLSVNKQLLIRNRTLDNFMRRKAEKQNIYQNCDRHLDLLRSRSNFMEKQKLSKNSKIKLNRLQVERKKQNRLKKLHQKLQKIKNLKQNQTLPQKQKNTIIKMLDNEDQNYSQIIDFFNLPKNQFLKKLLQNQYSKDKAQKNRKNPKIINS